MGMLLVSEAACEQHMPSLRGRHSWSGAWKSKRWAGYGTDVASPPNNVAGIANIAAPQLRNYQGLCIVTGHCAASTCRMRKCMVGVGGWRT